MASKHGATAEIARAIADRLNQSSPGLTAMALPVSQDPDPSSFTAVVLGSGSNDVLVYRATGFDASGQPTFAPAQRFAVGQDPVGLTIADVHRHALGLQKHFLDGLARMRLAELPARTLVPPAEVARGNFLAFDIDDAEGVHDRIAARDITIDRTAPYSDPK